VKEFKGLMGCFLAMSMMDLLTCHRLIYLRSLLVGAFGKRIVCNVKMEYLKLDKKLVGPTTNQWAKMKGGYVVAAFIKLLELVLCHFKYKANT